MPWKSLLSSSEVRRRLARLGMIFCSCPVTPFQHPFLDFAYSTDTTLAHHCHCRRPGSLSCRASAAVQRAMLQKFFEGTVFNSSFPMYRSMANGGRPTRVVMYFGSVRSGQSHYLYLWSPTESWARKMARERHLGFSAEFIGGGRQAAAVVMWCYKCASEPDRDVYTCALDVRSLLMEMTDRVERWSGSGLTTVERRQIQDHLADVYHAAHDRALESYYRRGIPVPSRYGGYPYCPARGHERL